MKLTLLSLLLSMTSSMASIDQVDTPEVFQREYIYTNSQITENIQTYGVLTCVAVVIKDLDSNAALIHFDASSDIDKGLSEVLSNFTNQGSLEIGLYGGQYPYKLEEKILNELRNRGLKTLKVDRNIKSTDSKNINVNLITGTVSEYEEIYSNASYNERQFKLDRMKFSKKLFKHQDSVGGGDPIPYVDEDINFLYEFELNY